MNIRRFTQLFVVIIALALTSCNNEPELKTTFQIDNQEIIFEEDKFKTDLNSFVLISTDTGDVNNDRINDLVALIQMNSQGSGTFYYLNVLLGDNNKTFNYTDEQFVGDRIQPDFLSIYKPGSISKVSGAPIHKNDYGQIVFGYYTRFSEQPMSDAPKLYLTSKWKLTNGQLEPVEHF